MKAIQNSKIAVAGLGGLGSNIAVMLARSGVGQLLLVDFDVVDESNLNRQHYSRVHLGQKKTKALETQIREINPNIKIITRDVVVGEDNIQTLFSGYPIICEAFDRPEAKALLVNTVLEKLDSVVVSGCGMAGYESSNLIKTCRRMERLYVCGDMTAEIGDGMKLTAARVQICAGHQANMALRLLMGIEEE